MSIKQLLRRNHYCIRTLSVKMGRGKIPDRWEDYKCLGKQIAGTRFITFKVPLKKELTGQLSPEEQFTPENLIDQIQSLNKQLGLVIDLTNTKRYYNPNVFYEKSSADYVKIFTEGHVVPSKRVQSEFFTAVDTFLSKTEDENMLIGVHCTHGLNRTGYLVCRYMIDQLSFTPDDAIAAYDQARGHSIERKNYLDDLRGIHTVSEAGTEEGGEEKEQNGRMASSSHREQQGNRERWQRGRRWGNDRHWQNGGWGGQGQGNWGGQGQWGQGQWGNGYNRQWNGRQGQDEGQWSKDQLDEGLRQWDEGGQGQWNQGQGQWNQGQGQWGQGQREWSQSHWNRNQVQWGQGQWDEGHRQWGQGQQDRDHRQRSHRSYKSKESDRSSQEPEAKRVK